MQFQPRKMGRLAWIAGGAAAWCLTAASIFAQSESDDQWTPVRGAPSQSHAATRDDGWNAREDARESADNDPSGGLDSANRGVDATPAPTHRSTSSSAYSSEQDRPAPARAGSQSYSQQRAAPQYQNQRPAPQASQQSGPSARNDAARSNYNARPTDQYGRPLRAGYQSSNQPSTYQQGYSQSAPSYRGNSVGSSDQDRNAYYGYRGPNGRMAMVDSGDQPHLATPGGQSTHSETLPAGPMSSGMGPTMQGEHVMGEEWEGEPGEGPGPGPDSGCGCEGGQCNGNSCGCRNGCCWLNNLFGNCGNCGGNGNCGGGSCGGGSCGGNCGGNCGQCNGNCCCGPLCQIINTAICCDWFHDFTAQAGVNAFRGPLDVAFNGTKGNFGFDEGFNWGVPMVDGFAGQVGMNFVQSDLTTGDFSDRNQIFFTGGLFYRNMGECGFQGGVVYDYLHDDWNGIDSGINLGQIRGSVSYVFCQNELGFWFTDGVSDSQATIHTVFEGQPGVVASSTMIKAADIYALYYRRHFCGGGEARIWGGVANQLGAVVGADMSMPLGDTFSIEGGFEYVIPRTNSDAVTNSIDSSNEAWNIGINLVWHPRCHAHDSFCSCSRPMFDVADNSTLLMRGRVTPDD